MTDRQPSVLILGGGHSEIPLVKAAKQRGLRVITTGNRPGDPGHAIADQYVACDYSDPEAVLDVATGTQAQFIVSACNDFAATSSAYAAELLGLPGHDPHAISLVIHHKDRFRALASRLGMSVPAATPVRSLDEALRAAQEIGWPVLVKPVDLTGGKGITLCRDAQELSQALTSAKERTRGDQVLVEEFVEGTGHGITAFIRDRKIVFALADDEQYGPNPYLVAGTTTPSSMTADDQARVHQDLGLMARELHLVDGLLHAQCIVGPGGPRIIEVCRRCPGDLYPTFVALATGMDYAGAVLTAEMGQMDIRGETEPAHHTVLRRCIMANRPGRVGRVRLSEFAASRKVEEMQWWKPGDRVDDPLVEKLGIIFLGLRDRDELEAARAASDDLVRIEWMT